MGRVAASDACPLPAAPRRPVSSRDIDVSRIVVAVILLAAVPLLGLQELVHGHLGRIDEYDDGVYFSAALNLSHCLFPYTDYGFIQPPLTSLVLLPFAWLSNIAGTKHAFEAARLFICAVAVLNVWLMGRLLRTRSLAERAAAMLLMIIYPGSLSSAQTVLIEPLLVLACLLAINAAFPDGVLSTSKHRQVVAGLIFGVAIATKLWAAAPLAVLITMLWFSRRRNRRQAIRVLLMATAGFLAVSVPFAVASPGSYFSQVFITQAVRPDSGYHWPSRLADLSGFAGLVHLTRSLGINEHVAVAVIVALVATVGLLAVADLLGARRTLDVEWFAVVSGVLIVIMFLAAPSYYYHYSGFAAPFAAIAGARVVALIDSGRRSRAKLAVPVIVGLLLAITASDVTNVVRAPAPQAVPLAAKALVPSTGCVLFLEPAVGLLMNRYTGGERGCPHVVDYLGEQRVLDHGHSQEPRDELSVPLQRRLLTWISASDTIVVGGESTSWGPSVRRYVAAHFQLHRLDSERMQIYVRTSNNS